MTTGAVVERTRKIARACHIQIISSYHRTNFSCKTSGLKIDYDFHDKINFILKAYFLNYKSWSVQNNT